MNLISENRCFDGVQGVYEHESTSTGTTMRFAVFRPPGAEDGNPVPVLYWLSGLTCTEENFTVKAGAQRLAAELNLLIVAPDTSPRGDGVPDDESGPQLVGRDFIGRMCLDSPGCSPNGRAFSSRLGGG